jgi:hypothetical protein
MTRLGRIYRCVGRCGSVVSKASLKEKYIFSAVEGFDATGELNHTGNNVGELERHHRGHNEQ